MGKLRLESYSSKSMEAGPDGWDGIRRAEAYRGIDDEEEIDELREQLSGVPEDTKDDIHILTSREDVDRVRNSTLKGNTLEFNEGEDEYERLLAEIEGWELPKEQGKYFHSMSMSDIARDITKSIDVPTQRDVKNATKIDLEEIEEEGYDEFDKYMAEIE